MHYCTSYGPDKFGRTHGRTHVHRTKIVTTMSRLPASGLDKNVGGVTALCTLADDALYFVLSLIIISQSVSELLSGHDFHSEFFKGTFP